MANIKTVFYGTKESDTDGHELQCYINKAKDIYIEIDSNDYIPSFICLDKSTAIKLSKVLRTEINKMQDE